STMRGSSPSAENPSFCRTRGAFISDPSGWRGRTSVEARGLVVLGSPCGELAREAVIGELVQPDSRGNRHGAGIDLGALAAHLRARRRLGAELPALVDEIVE